MAAAPRAYALAVLAFFFFGAAIQGLTLVHFSAQLKRIYGTGGECGSVSGVFRRYQESGGGVKGVFVSETAQVELKSGRV